MLGYSHRQPIDVLVTSTLLYVTVNLFPSVSTNVGIISVGLYIKDGAQSTWCSMFITLLLVTRDPCTTLCICTSWLRQCTTKRKVAGSIPDGVIGIFHWHNPSGRTMALGVDSASNRNEYQEYFLGGKGGRCVELTTLPPSCADCLEIWEPQPPGTLRACPGL
jgi:hypothetical protein